MIAKLKAKKLSYFSHIYIQVTDIVDSSRFFLLKNSYSNLFIEILKQEAETYFIFNFQQLIR